MPYLSRRPAQRRRKYAKRWYVDATIPKRVPFVGGSSFRAGSGTLTKRSLQSFIRSTGEQKQKIIAAVNTVDLKHNTIYTLNPFGNIAIGTGTPNRIGSSIFVKEWSVGMLLTNIAGIQSTSQYRVMVVGIENQHLSGDDTLTAGVGSTSIFVEGSNYMLLSKPDPNRCQVLHDEVVTLPIQDNSTATAIQQKLHHFSVCKNKELKFLTPTGNYLHNKNYYMLVMPYIAAGATGTTVVGTCQWQSVVTFTDA